MAKAAKTLEMLGNPKNYTRFEGFLVDFGGGEVWRQPVGTAFRASQALLLAPLGGEAIVARHVHALRP